MRLKEDSTSWRSSGIVKRDYQHDHSQPQGPVRLKAKKDTNRWCKGRVGIPHDYENKVPPNDTIKFRKIDICKNCGRQSYTNVKYYCREHKTWDTSIYWNDTHTHATTEASGKANGISAL